MAFKRNYKSDEKSWKLTQNCKEIKNVGKLDETYNFYFFFFLFYKCLTNTITNEKWHVSWIAPKKTGCILQFHRRFNMKMILQTEANFWSTRETQCRYHRWRMHKSINITLEVWTLTLHNIYRAYFAFWVSVSFTQCINVLICQRRIENGALNVRHNLHKYNVERLVYSSTLFPCVISSARIRARNGRVETRQEKKQKRYEKKINT